MLFAAGRLAVARDFSRGDDPPEPPGFACLRLRSRSSGFLPRLRHWLSACLRHRIPVSGLASRVSGLACLTSRRVTPGPTRRLAAHRVPPRLAPSGALILASCSVPCRAPRAGSRCASCPVSRPASCRGRASCHALRGPPRASRPAPPRAVPRLTPPRATPRSARRPRLAPRPISRRVTPRSACHLASRVVPRLAPCPTLRLGPRAECRLDPRVARHAMPRSVPSLVPRAVSRRASPCLAVPSAAPTCRATARLALCLAPRVASRPVPRHALRGPASRLGPRVLHGLTPRSPTSLRASPRPALPRLRSSRLRLGLGLFGGFGEAAAADQFWGYGYVVDGFALVPGFQGEGSHSV
jgi:hypothetical protein